MYFIFESIAYSQIGSLSIWITFSTKCISSKGLLDCIEKAQLNLIILHVCLSVCLIDCLLNAAGITTFTMLHSARRPSFIIVKEFVHLLAGLLLPFGSRFHYLATIAAVRTSFVDLGQTPRSSATASRCLAAAVGTCDHWTGSSRTIDGRRCTSGLPRCPRSYLIGACCDHWCCLGAWRTIQPFVAVWQTGWGVPRRRSRSSRYSRNLTAGTAAGPQICRSRAAVRRKQSRRYCETDFGFGL